ncbi:hypothetical protein HDV00_001799 [Rhizophlyctis rosea]|nr:hypothetical protein HDV00_001799 [Rhizophlyctis rosea]
MTLAEQTKIIKDLDRSLAQNQYELNQLREKSKTVAERAEASLAAEQVWQNTIAEQRQTITTCTQELSNSQEQVKHLEEEVERLKGVNARHKASQKFLRNANERNVAHLKSALNRAMGTQERQSQSDVDTTMGKEPDPDLSESSGEVTYKMHLRMYTERYETELNLLHQMLEESKREKELLVKQTDELLLRLPSEEEWQRLRTKCYLSESIADKLQQQLQETTRSTKILKTQYEQLAKDHESLLKDLKRTKEAMHRQRKESTRKDARLRDFTVKIKSFEAMKISLESKLKTMITAQMNKDHLIRDLKQKRDEMAKQLAQKISTEEELAAARSAVKRWEADALRKEVLLKRWKEKFGEADKERQQTHTLLTKSVDPKIHASSELARRNAEARIDLLEKKVLESRVVLDKLKKGLIGALEDGMRRGLVGRDRSGEFDAFMKIVKEQCGELVSDGEKSVEEVERDVLGKARMISKQVLDMDLSDVMSSDSGVGSVQMEQRWQDILSSESIEINLTKFLRETLAAC